MRIAKYIAGAISGLTFGLLFAPKKGEELRDQIKKGGKNSKQEALSVLIEAFKEAGLEAIDEAKKSQPLEDAIENSKEKMQEYFSQIEKTGRDIASRAKEKLDELHDMAEDASTNFKKTAVKKANTVKKSVVARSKKAVKNVKTKLEKSVAEAKKPVAKKVAPKKTTKAPAKTKLKKVSNTLKTTVKKISKKVTK